MGFEPTRYDRDLWFRKRDDASGYDYTCTHVDDFKIVAKDPQFWMALVQERFLIKQAEEPKYYLGNNYRFDEQSQQWLVGSETHVKECIAKVQRVHGEIKTRNAPLPPKDCHPEIDESPLLNLA